ncbi:hypothetical protein [Winogradskyella bathintestinalis]|uniref:Uncharacterized protein n=1 Tax=Winogradskyella bathintestinalis TaxID=3035208 RepID=A0ABT7ZYI6_9FLAO|nr:hypothetical protein [Winogradskyella bathintestinalis]MDN3493808.1 hypothetical protein [Winogradskyella bathintestinalis]
MSGEYMTSFDLSPMLKYANETRPNTQDRPRKEKVDTTIVFNELFENYKDSIAALSEAERDRLEKLKGMVLKVRMDEETSTFDFNMKKFFFNFSDLENINEQVDDAMNIAKDIGNKDAKAPEEQLNELTKIDKVVYAFENNTFSRVMPNAVAEQTEDIENDLDEEIAEDDDNDYAKQFEMQFEKLFSKSNYTLIYKFKNKVKSVSKENAVISKDGKTVTYKVPWNTLKKDASSMNLNVVLED